MKSTIRLFKAVPIEKRGKTEPNENILQSTLEHGFLIAPEVIFNYSETELMDLIRVITEEFGLTGEQMNASFHKSWKKVESAEITQLVMEQLVHYFTTYGFEQLEIYSQESVYVPQEKLEIPEREIEGFRFIIIKGYTKEELKQKLFELLESGIALGEQTIQDLIDIATFLHISENEIQKIKNKEVKIAMYDYLDQFPEDPLEFLRFCIYKSIEQTLLIKNDNTIKKIRNSKNLSVLRLFTQYKEKHGFERLAEIFLRFKPLFLAFRTNTQMRKYTNKIRKLAKKYHKPMKADYLNEVTKYIKNDVLDKQLLIDHLQKVNTFRKIRLAYALKYRTIESESILYRIRNGKGYATGFEFEQKEIAKEILDLVIDSIVEDIKRNVDGKRIYIPDFIRYTLPATEKQFTGNLPTGTRITLSNDIIVGINWNNVDDERIDLDLSIINPKTGKIGWDSQYRTEKRNILFSGDLTDAPPPDGASELFYLEKQQENSFIMFVNFFNFLDQIEVPFQIVVANGKHKQKQKESFMIDPNKVIMNAKTNINAKQKILGLITTTPDETAFYFAETNIGGSITSFGSPFGEHSRIYLNNFYRNSISLNEILERAGGVLVEDPKDCEINLSPETIERDTIIKLLY